MGTLREGLGQFWADGRSPTVECLPPVLEQIRSEVVDGLRAFPRGGVEVGGVLFGKRSAGVVHITARLPLVCEHAFGPGFVLSEPDETALAELLSQARSDPQLAGLEAAGWYHSHTRSDIFMSDRDVDLHRKYFPQSWQVALVLRPEPTGRARARFFVRHPDGSLASEPNYGEFVLTPLLSGRAGPSLLASRQEVEPEPPSARRPKAPPAPPQEPEPPLPAAPSARYGEPRWQWFALALALVFLAAAVIGRVPARPRPQPSAARVPVQLRALDTNGQLTITWNQSAAPVQAARSAVLEITDGASKTSLNLDHITLANGSVTYARHSGRVNVVMKLDGAGGPVQGAALFSGDPVNQQKGPDPAELLRQRDQALRERNAANTAVGQLRAALHQQMDKVTELEQTVNSLRAQPAPEQVAPQ